MMKWLENNVFPFPHRFLLTIVLLGVLTLAVSGLAGCGTMAPQPNMNVDQLKAIVADKNASVACSTIMGPWGQGKIVLVNMDQRVISDGGVTVNPDCTVKIENVIPPKPAPVVTPAVPK